MAYRLVALDLDGTTLNSRKEISPRTLTAIRRARERGVHVAIATGRTVHSTLYFSRMAGTNGPNICCNGAGVLDEAGKVAIARPLPQGSLTKAIELCKAEGLFVECYGAEGVYLDEPVRHLRTYMKWVRRRQGIAGSFLSWMRDWRLNRFHALPSLLDWANRGQEPILKLFATGGAAELARVTEAITVALPALEITASGPDNVEVTAGGVSKGTALRQMGEWLKIPRSEIIAVGDSFNDLSMLTYAGLGVAMGNAAEEIKSAAGHTTATCDEDGVAQVIEEFCL